MKKIFIILTALSGILLLTQCTPGKNNNRSDLLSYMDPTDTVALTMPYNKMLAPAGKMVFFGDSTLENHALDITLSPDRKYAAVEGRYSIVILDAVADTIVYRLRFRDVMLNSMSTYSGIQWVTLGGESTLFWGTRNAVIRAVWEKDKIKSIRAIRFDPAGGASASLPNEVIVGGSESHPVLYVVLNGNDRIVKLDLTNGKEIWKSPTGLAPYGLVMADGKLFVTNWSGSIPVEDTVHTAGIPWGKAQVDPLHGDVSSGSVSVIDPHNGSLIREITVGLHPNDIVASPDGKFVYVANGNEDYISVINTGTLEVTEKISVRLMEDKNPYFGDSPNGLALSVTGDTLYVANGMDNAVALVQPGSKASSNGTAGRSRILGFIPVGAYPGGIAAGSGHKLFVANIEAIGARMLFSTPGGELPGSSSQEKPPANRYFNAHRMMAAVSIVPIPNADDLEAYTQTVISTNRLNRIEMAGLLPRKNQKPVPVPERIGEPSVFTHVVYIIKENRTYDQVLGDMEEGKGAPELCTFGREVTPNTHSLVSEFVLLDNYEASGKCSAEGHLWTDASMVTDYIEKNVRAWFRSYTHVLYDAMAYPKTGFLWDNALDHGKSVRIYGEASVPQDYGERKWMDIYHDFLDGKPVSFKNVTTIDRVRGILSPTYPAYDSHNFTDIMRAAAFIDDLHAWEEMEGDSMPALTIMALPNDHTAGTSPNHPTPRAMVADNDLALGQIIEALSRSRFWKNTVVFVTEDDSQAGWDHLSAYRTIGMVISPYSRLQKTVSIPYNQTSMIRTIEQILGLPPMNIEDATAVPMTGAFTGKANYTPYASLPNEIPLDEMNPALTALRGRQKYYAKQSQRLIQKGIDNGEDDLMNRIIWSSSMGKAHYPAKYAGTDTDDDD